MGVWSISCTFSHYIIILLAIDPDFLSLTLSLSYPRSLSLTLLSLVLSLSLSLSLLLYLYLYSSSLSLSLSPLPLSISLFSSSLYLSLLLRSLLFLSISYSLSSLPLSLFLYRSLFSVPLYLSLTLSLSLSSSISLSSLPLYIFISLPLSFCPSLSLPLFLFLYYCLSHSVFVSYTLSFFSNIYISLLLVHSSLLSQICAVGRRRGDSRRIPFIQVWHHSVDIFPCQSVCPSVRPSTCSQFSYPPHSTSLFLNLLSPNPPLPVLLSVYSLYFPLFYSSLFISLRFCPFLFISYLFFFLHYLIFFSSLLSSLLLYCCRVASDLNHAQLIYDELTKTGIRVWFDKTSILPGRYWEQEFTDGLLTSACFVCLLSRDAINHKSIPSQNFNALNAGSRVDSVYMEWSLGETSYNRSDREKSRIWL